LHFLGIRLSCSWNPPDFLTEVVTLDPPLFPTMMIPDKECRKLIDQFSKIEELPYQPPGRIPSASH
ncbi:uncharacterized protein EV154DRAFT_401872, partial [Mucor mucedo]|uniref:uncharacterized protein n=1 Tax=Mucor mucedo TaxID=29922 RepID=UPI0022208C75